MIVMIICYDGSKKGLVYARPGDQMWNDIKWGYSHKQFVYKVTDIVLWRDQVYGLLNGAQYNGHAVCFGSIELRPSCEVKATSLVSGSFCPVDGKYSVSDHIEGRYLVESAGKLLMVLEMKRESAFSRFIVLKLGFGWERLDNLGNQALFIGKNYSISVPVLKDDEHNNIKGNHIYFMEHVPLTSNDTPEAPVDVRSSYISDFDMKTKGTMRLHVGKEKDIQCYGYCWLIPSFSLM